MSTNFLLKGGCVLTLGSKTPNFVEADILIEGDRIAEVGPGLRARDAEPVDARDTIVMPGFIDGHRHTWKSLFRNAGTEDVSAVQMQPDDVYAATLVGLLAAIEAGITTVVDWADHRHPDAALQAHNDAGLRTVLATPDTTREVNSPLTYLAHASDDSSSWSLARDSNLRIHAHVNTPGTIANWAEQGMLGPDVTLVHCSGVTDAEVGALASSRCGVVLSPASEMAAGATIPRIQSLIDRSIRPGLGVDEERLAPGDIFAQMRALISFQHATTFDRKLAGKAGLPHLMTTREVIRHGTVDGARAIGLGSVTGSIEAGKQADVIVLRADRPNIVPVNDPIGAVVWGMDTSNVDWVFVAGRPQMRSGKLTADPGRARDLAISALRRVTESAGALTTAFSGEGS